jgi:hypothetical protein
MSDNPDLSSVKDSQAVSLPDPQQAVEDKLSMDFEIRQRTEYRNGYTSLPDPLKNPALISFQRSRIGLNYTVGKISTSFSMQDVRTWGEVKTKADAPSLGVYEAWMEFFLSENLSVKLGRQTPKYDDQRLMSNTDWNNVATSHDLALLKYEQNSTKVHLGMAYNNDKDKLFETNYPVELYKAMQYLYLSQKFKNGIKVSLLEIIDGYQKTASDDVIFFRNTAGLNLDYETQSGKFMIGGSGFLQGGEDKSGNKINAYAFGVKTSIKILPTLKATIGNDYYSGTDGLDTSNTVNGAFNNLFGSGHAFCGYMDYFTSIDAHTKGGGLSDSYVKISIDPGKKTSLGLDFHNFMLANNVVDVKNTTGFTALDKNLGSEIDFSFIYKAKKNFVVKMGYSVMLATKSMSSVRGGDFNEYADWAYITLTFTPKAVLK